MSRRLPGSRRRTASVVAGMAVVAAGAGILARLAGGAVGPAVTVTPRSTSVSSTSVPSTSAPSTSVSATATSITVTPMAPGTVGAALPAASRFFPDHSLHPGEVNPAATAAQLCATGFSTRTVRPPVAYTDHIKVLELGSGGTVTGPSGTTYTVVGEHLMGVVSDYELDHLISLEIGGNPEDPRNLWMEPWERKGAHPAPAGQGAESKDVVENRLHREVCAGTITLSEAQTEVASNWETAR